MLTIILFPILIIGAAVAISRSRAYLRYECPDSVSDDELTPLWLRDVIEAHHAATSTATD